MPSGILTIVKNGTIINGTVIEPLPGCTEKFNKEACNRFYQNLRTKEDGFYKCPSGYTVYKRTIDDAITFYNGFRIKGYFDKKKNETNCGCPVISSGLFEKMLHEDDNVRKLKSELNYEKDIHKDLLHDVRKLDGLIKDKAQEIVNQYPDPTGELYEIIQKVRNMSAMEELIACKYSVYDLVSNISALSLGNKVKISVYKKFDKARYILLNYKNKNTTIEFDGETEYCYYVNLAYFDVLPFLLLENAVKYSTGTHNVKVKFSEHNQELSVSISSFGPYCPKEEISKLFEKNYRGDVAKKVTSEGTGVGLYLVKQICEQHGIDINISTEYVKKNNGMPYGYFIVDLHFKRKKPTVSS